MQTSDLHIKPVVFITGANGQLGQCFQELEQEYPAYHFMFFSSSDFPIENSQTGAALFARHQPSYCINCAAYTAVDKAESDSARARLINGTAPGILAQLCAQYGTGFFHVSTDYVFNGNARAPYLESDPTDPINEYGSGKLMGERAVLQHNPHAIIIRSSWLYSNYGNNFVRTMKRLMLERTALNIVADQTGTPTYAPDLVRAILDIMAQLKTDPGKGSGVYHFSNSGVTTWYEFAMEIKALTGAACILNPIESSGYPTPAKRPMYSVLSKEKIQSTFGIALKDWKAQLAICLSREFKDAFKAIP